MENIFHYNDTTQFLTMSLFVEYFLFLGLSEFACAQLYAELSVAYLALEDQLLPLSILRFIEGDVIVAFGTFNSLHSCFL
jgi:hypothetical protein